MLRGKSIMTVEQYTSYMNSVEASDDLHERLLGLAGQTAAKARRRAFAPRAALAACAVLLMGACVFAVMRTGRMERGAASSAQAQDVTSETAIDLAPADESFEPGQKTLGGYELHETRAGVDVACYYVLPWIDYGAANEAAAVDWALPEGVTRREMTAEEIAALLGGESVLTDHLDWGGYALSGNAWWNADGTLWGVGLYGYAGPLDHFEFMQRAGELPPTCIVFEGSVEQTVWDVTVTADKYDGDGACGRRVSFLTGGYGYRFDLTATDADAAETRVSRLVRLIAVGGGTHAEALSPDGTVRLPASAPDSASPSDAVDGQTAASVPPQG